MQLAAARSKYKEMCSAHARGAATEEEVLAAKNDVDVYQLRLEVLENAWEEQQRLDALQQEEDDVQARRKAATKVRELEGVIEREFLALLSDIEALGNRFEAIRGAQEGIARQAAAHRDVFGPLESFGELVRAVRESDFRMRDAVVGALSAAGFGTFVPSITGTSSQYASEGALGVKLGVTNSIASCLDASEDD
jgi:hypothetical protein